MDGLTSKEIKQLVNFMTKEKWEEIKNGWNRGRIDFLIQTTTIPNYFLLPKLNPKNGKLNKEDRQ